MLELTGNNLGKRHQELNIKVREAFDNKSDFDELKNTEEKSDVDRLFKIDLAIACRNIDYIVDTLKCGDSLYISRALKCSWLFEDEFTHVINPDYLHQDIFPYMSTKMKKKTLAAIASHIKDTEKAKIFYTYCLSTQMDNFAWDFLVKTSDTEKKEYLNSHIYIKDSVKFEHFFGHSLELIELYLSKRKTAKQNVDDDVFIFRYLYSFSAEKYLNLLEAYTELPTQYTYYRKNRFGGRMSKDIMVHHKSRVLEKPWIYLNKLNTKMILKFSSSSDAKLYLVPLLPSTADSFWSMNYYSTYKDFFQLLPANEIYPFLKQLFTTQYPNKLFEMDIYFYRLRYYDLLTAEERHAWALKHLEQKKELLGPGRDFIWYQFVKFDLAFPAIKKYIFITTCQDKRAEMIRVLIHAASNQEELEKLLSHYYERHVNEDSRYKEKFIDEIIEVHNVFEFNEKCWKPIYQLLHSLNVFETRQYSDTYTSLAIIYNIIHTNEIPEVLEQQCKYLFDGRSCLFTLYYEKLTPDQHQLIYQWFIKYFEDGVKELMNQSPSDDEVKKSLIKLIYRALTFMDGYKKSKDDCPGIVMDGIKLYWDEFSDYKWFRNTKEIMSEAVLLRLLKKDKMLLTNKLPDIKQSSLSYTFFNIKKLLRKIRIYFSNDVTKIFQTFFEEWFADKSHKPYNYMKNNTVILSLFYLADEEYKIKLMSKYAPTEAKIQHGVIDKNILQIQEAICRFAFYSRPPVPLPNMLEYIKGDYVHFCIPMFGSYLVNLPMPQSLKFIEAILNSPVSIQKHGLRLAFVSYDPENLKQLILDVWKKTKNVSMRAVIYKALFSKIKKDNEVNQSKLYPVLKMLTSDLHEDDQDDIFDLLVSSALPARFNGDYLQTAWIMVRKLPDQNSINNNRKAKVIGSIGSHIEQIDREFCRTQIIEEHIQFFDKQTLLANDFDINNLIDQKWILIVKYITHFDEEEINSSLEVLHLIMKKCLEMWDEVSDNKYIVREFLIKFVQNVMYRTDYRKDMGRKPYIVPVLEYILDFFKNSWPLAQIYIITWELQLLILGVTAVGIGQYNSDKKAITYDQLSSAEVANKFAEKIVDFIKDLMSKQQFYNCFYPTFETSVIETTNKMTAWTNLDSNVLIGQVSYALTKYMLFEANMLALRILPVDLPCSCIAYYSDVMQAIKDYNNYELNAFAYSKFVYADFIKRL